MQDRPKKPARAPKQKTIGVTEFKAKCLALIDEVATGRLDRVQLTKRGRAVAEISKPSPVRSEATGSSYGCMKGKIWIDTTWDATGALADVQWDAKAGILYNE